MRKGERIPSVSSSYSGRIVTTIQNGCFVCDRPLNGNEFIGTLETFLDLAKLVADPGGADTPDLPVTCTRRKAETLKPNNQRSVPSHRLPFVKSMSGHMNFWSVPATGEFAGGCQAGEALAKIYLKHLRENDYAGGCLQMIVADMCRQSEKCRDAGGAEADSVSGQIVGFFSVLDKWLHTAATMIGEPLDNLDVAALLSTANAGIRSAPETQG